MTEAILWDTDNDEQASNWDGTDPVIDIDDGIVYIKELGCHCDPTHGAGCGGCVDEIVVYKIGGRFVWKMKAATK